jgi:hypothetical protein
MEVCSPADQVVYDVTELVISGYVSTEDDLVDDALSPGWSGYPVGGKVVVLTEGRSDSRIIADSLRLLYPHLLDYFTFMDFDGIRVAGGAGNLANIVKAFAAAGIVNRVLALFDNDTAGTEAVQMLRGLCIRGNIRIAQLPYLPALCSYPTIGPTGRVDMDVNGMAASIELYLGSDVLTAPSGQLSPVQWTGYNTRLRQYQGEVIGEEQIRERFLAKVESCRANADGADAADWTGIRAILHVLFNSFHDADRREILEFADEHPLE